MVSMYTLKIKLIVITSLNVVTKLTVVTMVRPAVNQLLCGNAKPITAFWCVRNSKKVPVQEKKNGKWLNVMEITCADNNFSPRYGNSMRDTNVKKMYTNFSGSLLGIACSLNVFEKITK